MTLRYLDVVDVGDVPAVADGVLQRAVRDDRETTRRYVTLTSLTLVMCQR